MGIGVRSRVGAVGVDSAAWTGARGMPPFPECVWCIGGREPPCGRVFRRATERRGDKSPRYGRLPFERGRILRLPLRSDGLGGGPQVAMALLYAWRRPQAPGQSSMLRSLFIL